MKKILLALGIIAATTVTAFASTLFTDDSQFASWFKDSVYEMQEEGIMDGYPDGSFQPEKTVNRAELAVILDRLIDNIEDDDNIYEDESDDEEEDDDTPIACTMEARAGLVIYLRDTTADSVSTPSFAINGKDKTSEFTSSDINTFSGLFEGSGYYTLEVSAPGYLGYTETIKLEKDQCHVITQYRTITMIED